MCPCKWTSNKRPPLLWDLICLINRVVLNTGSHCIALNPDTFRQKRILNDYSGKREFWMITQVVSSAMLCTGSCTEKCWAKLETKQLADGVRMYGGLLCSDSWRGAHLQRWKSSWALSLAPSTSLLQVSKYSFFFFTGGGGVNADNSFSVAFDFPFHWGSECRQFIFCFNFPFQGGGGVWMQTIHFLLLLIFLFTGGVNADNSFSVLIFLFTSGGGGGGGWIQTIHFLLVLIFLFTWGGGGGRNECRHFIFCWKTENSNKFVHVLYLLATLFGGCFISQPSRYKEIKRCKLEWNNKKKIWMEWCSLTQGKLSCKTAPLWILNAVSV